MACCGSGGISVPSALGFKSAKCCAAPCPNFPMNHVVICLRVNSNSQISIQQGCFLGSTLATGDTDPVCSVDYRSGVTEDSWGRKCRVVTWDRFVPSDTFVRIRVCGVNDGCQGACGSDADYTTLGTNIHNALLQYSINGVSLMSQLQATLIGGGVNGCILVGCKNATVGATDCCQTAGVSVFTSLTNIPWDSQIQVGPIGQLLFNSFYS